MIILTNEDGELLTPTDLSENFLHHIDTVVQKIADALPAAQMNGIHPVCPVCGLACRDTDVIGNPDGWEMIEIGQKTERTLEHGKGEETLIAGDPGSYAGMDTEVDTVLKCPEGHFMRFTSLAVEFE